MDCPSLYKKKNLKFTNSHVSRNARQQELSKARESSRYKRTSMLGNCLEEEDVSSTENVNEKILEKCDHKKPQSRLDMLFKWKEEKKIKKELESKKKKPFYVGGHAQRYNPSTGLPLTTLSNTSSNSSKFVKSRLVPPSSISQPAKTTNISKQITPSASKIAASSKIPSKFGLNKVKSTNEIKTTNMAKNPKTFGNSAVPPSSRQGTLPRTAKGNIEMKSGVKTLMNEKSVKLKAPTQTAIPTISSSIPKGIFVPKPRNQVNSMAQNVTIRKQEICFKPTFNKQTGGNKASNSGSIKKLEGKSNDIKSQREKTPLKQNLDKDIPAEIFNCDISIIKNPPSFAPANFNFIPPAGLLDFSLDAEVKETIISRTSTPSKPSKESTIPVVETVVEDSFHVPLEANADKMKEIFDKFKKILEEDKELKTEDLHADSLINDVHLNKAEEKSSRDINLEKLQNEELSNSKEHFPIDGEIKECIKLLENTCTDSLVDVVGLNKTEVKSSKDINLVNLQNEELSNGREHFPVDGVVKESINLLEMSCTDSLVDVVGLNNIEKKSSKDINLVNLQKEELSRERFPVDGEKEECINLLEVSSTYSSVDVVGLIKTEEKSSKDINLVNLQNEELSNSYDKLLNEKIAEELEITNIDSPLDILDLDQSIDLLPKETELIKSDNDGKEHIPNEEEDKKCTEVLEDDIFSQQIPEKCIKKKSLSIPAKRRSMLKSIPALNSIAEIAETNETPSECPMDSKTSVNPACSWRLSKLVDMDESSAITPRRSARIKDIATRKCQFEDLEISSPILRNTPRRSMRLIDLNTPDKGRINSPAGKTNLTLDFERLALIESENINPHACFIGSECSPISKRKSKKVSLLYSPDKISAMRKSIRGDLMSFSPSD